MRRHDLLLHTPLGKWLPSHCTLQHREYYLNPITRCIYQRLPHYFRTYRPNRNTRIALEYTPTGHTTYLPKMTIPINPTILQQTKLQLHKTSIDSTYTTPTSHPTINSFHDYILTLQHWERELLTLHTIHSDLESMFAALHSRFIIATDGSANEGKGSFGWVIATSDDGAIVATGQGTAFGENISSFRCEAYGILAALQFILHIHYYYHQPQPHYPITWWCDSKSLIQQIQSNRSNLPNPNRYKLAEHDIEHTITHTLNLLPRSLHPHHLHSHQYDKRPIHTIPIPYRLNRIADKLADEHNSSLNCPMTKAPLLRPAGCQLHLNNGTITHSIP